MTDTQAQDNRAVPPEKDRLIDFEEVQHITGYGRTCLEEKIAAGEFPKPTQKWRRNKWLLSVVMAWIFQEFGTHQVNQPTTLKAHAAH